MKRWMFTGFVALCILGTALALLFAYWGAMAGIAKQAVISKP